MRSPSLGLHSVCIQAGVILAAILLLLFPAVTQAVLPPDLVVRVGSQLAGFFSLLAAIFVSIFASLGMLYVVWYERFKKYAVPIAFGLLAFALVVSNGFFIWQFSQSSSPVIPEYPTLQVATSSEDCQSCAFYGEGITLYVPDINEPLILELDLNRRQEPSGQYTHYYFLNGLFGTESVSDYTQFVVNDYQLQPLSFLTAIDRTEPVDASVRDVYSGEVMLPTGSLLAFTTRPLQADFVTRNKPEYTQLQSVIEAEVSTDGVTKTAYGLVENLHSNNYRKRIFFPGMDSLQAVTHQFVLWDQDGNFYMIDDSVVMSDTPAYPSHSWLLYKDAAADSAQKGFSTTITSSSEEQWTVSVPDFNNGVITVSVQQEYKNDANTNMRYLVSGEITDNNGTRTISGILRLIQ